MPFFELTVLIYIEERVDLGRDDACPALKGKNTVMFEIICRSLDLKDTKFQLPK